MQSHKLTIRYKHTLSLFLKKSYYMGNHIGVIHLMFYVFKYSTLFPNIKSCCSMCFPDQIPEVLKCSWLWFVLNFFTFMAHLKYSFTAAYCTLNNQITGCNEKWFFRVLLNTLSTADHFFKQLPLAEMSFFFRWMKDKVFVTVSLMFINIVRKTAYTAVKHTKFCQIAEF